DHRRQLLLRLARHGRESVFRRRGAIVVVGQRVDQLVAEAALRLEVADAALIAEVCQLGSLGDRIAHAAETIDEAELTGSPAVPHAALRDLVDLLRSLV